MTVPSAPQPHSVTRELALTCIADLGDEQVAAVSLLLLGAEHLRHDEVESGLLPGVEPAGHRPNVGVSHLMESARREQRADTGRAVERDRCAAVMSHILDAHLEVSLAEMHGTGDVPLGEFGILAHVDEHPRVRRAVHLMRGQLVDDRARVIEQVAGRLDHAASLAKTRPFQSGLGIGAHAREPTDPRRASTERILANADEETKQEGMRRAVSIMTAWLEREDDEHAPRDRAEVSVRRP